MRSVIAKLRDLGNFVICRNVLSDPYIDIDIPVDNKILKFLYSEYNSKLFGGALPKCRLKFAPLAKNFHGKAHVEWDGGRKIKDLLITIAALNKNDPKNVIDVLVHEMIHIWQYYMVAKTGDNSYSDDTYSFFAKGDPNYRGHQENFKRWMNKFN